MDGLEIQVGAIMTFHHIHPAMGEDRPVDTDHQQVGDIRLGRSFDQQPLQLEPAAVYPAHTHSRTGFKGSDQCGAFFHYQTNTLPFLAVDVLHGHQGNDGQQDQHCTENDPRRETREKHSIFVFVHHYPSC